MGQGCGIAVMYDNAGRLRRLYVYKVAPISVFTMHILVDCKEQALSCESNDFYLSGTLLKPCMVFVHVHVGGLHVGGLHVGPS